MSRARRTPGAEVGRARAQVPARMLLRVDPITCEAHGLCSELVPELLTTDEWGYPDPIRAAVPRTLEAHAKRAAKACPTLAIRLERVSS